MRARSRRCSATIRYLLEELLTGLFEVARADGELNPAEVDFLRRVAAIFGFDISAFEQIRARFSATARNLSGADDAYAVLGPVARARATTRSARPIASWCASTIPTGWSPRACRRSSSRMPTRRSPTINVAYDRIAKERKLR